jgi:hypothetical protein
MRITNYCLRTVCFLVICLLGNIANAEMIDFDDRDPASIPNGILTNEYESQGVIFHGSAYLNSPSPKSAPNYVVGPGFSFSFMGLPYVSGFFPKLVTFYTGSSTESKVFITATGPNGHVEQIITEGEIHGMTDLVSTPYIPNQFVSFEFAEGISSIELSGQSDAYIDDLGFYYVIETVPEPSIMILFLLSITCIIVRRFNINPK